MRETLSELLAGRQKQVVVDDSKKPSAVLLLLCETENGHHVLLTKRTSLVDDHKGEVSFPGGAFHHGEDTSLQFTALRESHEEIGVHPDNVLIVGELDDIITRSNYIISPFVGFLRAPQQYVPAPAEVAEVLEAPLEWLLDPANVLDAEQTPRHYAGRPVNGQYYEYNDSVIYGATFRILRQFLSLLPPGIR